MKSLAHSKRVIEPTLQRNSHLSLNPIQGDADLGFWQFSTVTGEINVCKNFSKLLVLCDSNKFTIIDLYRKVVPCWRNHFLTGIRKATQTGTIQLEFPIGQTRHNHNIWVRITGATFNLDDRGNCLLSGFVENISITKRAEAAKDDHVALINHEIRNPLTTVQLYTQLIQKKAISSKDTDLIWLSEKAQEQIQAMEIMASTYLDLATIKSGKLRLHLQCIELKDLLVNYIKQLELLYPSNNFGLTAAGTLKIMLDEPKILQVLNNLVNNAIKYSPAGSRINLSYKASKTTVIITVKDQGKGIPENEQGMLFTKYFRASAEENGVVKGHGLGLYMVKKIIHLHGGIVGARNAADGGAEFFFQLPRNL